MTEKGSVVELAEKWAHAEAPTEGDPMKVMLVELLTGEIRILANEVLRLVSLAEAMERVMEAAEAVAGNGYDADGRYILMDDRMNALRSALQALHSLEEETER